MAEADLKEIQKLVPVLMKTQMKEFWVDYDKEVDTLYISLKRPQRATDTETLDNGILVRYRNNEIVGYTILNASKIV